MVDVIIVGGGASGLACGIEAAGRGKQCLILEQKEKAGKKLYASGNGKCNFANRNVHPDFYHSVREECREAVSRIITTETCEEVEEFFLSMGVPSVERQGYLYPRSEQAASLVHAMEQVFIQRKGRLICEERVQGIQWNPEHSLVQVQTGQHSYEGKALVLATGGRAGDGLGSDGSGYPLAQMLGHSIIPPVPALCGLKCSEKGWNRLQGVRAKGRVELWQEEGLMGQDRGEIQFTRYGVSGIVIFNLSRYASLGLQKQKGITLIFDFLPEYTEKQLWDSWRNFQEQCGFRTILDILSGFLPDKLADFLIGRAGLSGKLPCSRLTTEEGKRLIHDCKQMKLQITDTNSFEQAQVTAGGVPLEEINPDTMESRLCRNSYLTGELLDVDAGCGGYNLMWAWETGRRAGRNI